MFLRVCGLLTRLAGPVAPRKNSSHRFAVVPSGFRDRSANTAVGRGENNENGLTLTQAAVKETVKPSIPLTSRSLIKWCLVVATDP